MYRTCYPALVRYLHRLVWDADQAQDLAQEAFARALTQRADNPKAYVFRVATNLARDEARSAIRRRKQQALLQNEAAARGPGEDPGTGYEHDEQRESVRRALDQLGDGDREALLLWDAGMSYEEIATGTGLSVGSVGTTLARARRRLVEAYQELEKDHAARR